MAAESERLSNYATEIADRVNAAWRRAGAKSVEAAEAYLEAGRLLLELRAECAYGAYKPALKRAGIPYPDGGAPGANRAGRHGCGNAGATWHCRRCAGAGDAERCQRGTFGHRGDGEGEGESTA